MKKNRLNDIKIYYMSNCTYNLRPADSYYQELVNRLTDRIGMPRIKVYESDTNNACATLIRRSDHSSPTTPIIAYNYVFIQDLWNVSYWAVVTAFAHEVAHHYNKDLYGGFFGDKPYVDQSSHRKELNADYFAGWILKCEGASLTDAKDLYNVLDVNSTWSHPDRYTRKLAVEKGWKQANCYYNPPQKVTRTKKTQSPDFGDVLLGLGLATLFGVGIAAIAGRR